jgi:hypothetical protein
VVTDHLAVFREARARQEQQLRNVEGAMPPNPLLTEAGWQTKLRSGVRIYAHPATGNWYSQEMALHLEKRRAP